MFSVFIDYVFFLLVFLKLKFNSSGFVFGSFLEVNYINSVMYTYNTLKESCSVTYSEIAFLVLFRCFQCYCMQGKKRIYYNDHDN